MESVLFCYHFWGRIKMFLHCCNNCGIGGSSRHSWDSKSHDSPYAFRPITVNKVETCCLSRMGLQTTNYSNHLRYTLHMIHSFCWAHQHCPHCSALLLDSMSLFMSSNPQGNFYFLFLIYSPSVLDFPLLAVCLHWRMRNTSFGYILLPLLAVGSQSRLKAVSLSAWLHMVRQEAACFPLAVLFEQLQQEFAASSSLVSFYLPTCFL